MLQVNGLSEMSVTIQERRKHSRAPVDSFDVAWWRKSPEELVKAIKERTAPKSAVWRG